jgi:hypothetical protein
MARLIVLPRPLVTLVNAIAGPYWPGRRRNAGSFIVNVMVTPFASALPAVELAVSQEGTLIE